MIYTISLAEIEQQVLLFMDNLGIPPVDRNLIIDGEMHRYRTLEDNSTEKTGAYCIFPDNLPAGFVQDWRKGIKQNWKFNTDGLPNEQREYFNSPEVLAKAEKLRKQREKEEQKKAIEASEHARILWENLKPADESHPYLQNKNVPCYGLHINSENKLAVPLRDINGNVKSLQWIDELGDKRFFEGTHTKGLFWAIALDLIKQQPDLPILIGEGYATMAKIHELTNFPCVAAMNCGALEKVSSIIKKAFPQQNIIIMADDDRKTQLKNGSNPGIDLANNACKKLGLQGVISPPFNSPDDGSDWDDFAILHNDDEDTKNILLHKISFACLPEKKKLLLDKVEKINAADLLKKQFDPIKWAVEGFLPAGLSILAGGPKVGKSILSLHLSLAVAIGGCALGKIFVQKGSVLYLALEDPQKRLQERLLGSDIGDNDDISKLDLVTRIPRQHEGGLDYIQWWLDFHNDARLIIIDTLQKFRRQLSKNADRYAEDYDVISDIKNIADKNDVAILIIHHLKKARDTDDWLNEISGSIGIAGAADTIFSLKRARVNNGGILHRTGRDVEEKDFAMTLDGYGWKLEGDIDNFTLPDWKKNIIKYIRENGEVSPMKISEVLKMNINTAKSSLKRLEKEGLLRKTGYGVYNLSE